MDPVSSLAAHARAGAALDLRVARLLAWFKRQDLTPLGYTSYRAFALARIDWADSWMRAVVSLVESPLERVKAAVCAGWLPLRAAVRAPGQTDREGEEAWIAAAMADRSSRRRPRPREVEVSSDVLETIEAARELARVHLGVPVDDAFADRYILAEWRRGDPAATRRHALAPPLAPAPLPPWCKADDPATVLVGPWEEPGSLADGLAKLDAVLARRRERVLEVGVLYRRVLAEGAWARDWATVGQMARGLGLDLRSVQRAKRLVDALDALPDTAAALACGEITLGEARRIASVATDATEKAWLRTVPWYTPPDFARLVELAIGGADVLPVAEAVVDALADAVALTDRVTFGVLRRRTPAPRLRPVHPDLPVAAAWLLAHTSPEPQAGVGRVKERDAWRCRNPECRRPTLRVQAHHVLFRRHGGTDADANLLTLCPACHLRGVHSGRLGVVYVGDVLEWRYPGRRVLEVA